MKTTQLTAQALLATSLAFSASSQAADEVNSYNLVTAKINYDFTASNTQSAFQAAADLVADKTKKDIIEVGFKTGNFLWHVARIDNDKGQQVGVCRVIGYSKDNSGAGWINRLTLGFNKQPLQYKAYCWDGTTQSKFSAETPFAYEVK